MVSRIGDVSQVGKREFATGGMASSFYSVESRRVKSESPWEIKCGRVSIRRGKVGGSDRLEVGSPRSLETSKGWARDRKLKSWVLDEPYYRIGC